VGTLSGGNQQKVMLAKWLNTKPDLLIFDEPTRGIDVGAKAEVHQILRNLRRRRGGIIISSDLPEVLSLGRPDPCDARGPQWASSAQRRRRKAVMRLAVAAEVA
jgi:rhamnose transport system ATP-binding protein